ncbi:MAG: hypothetical protein R2819_11155 [Allomuricauda sp.]
MYSEDKLVRQCLGQIEESLGWGPSDHWHNDVFSELSEKIQQKTQVLLSPTTLKRVWGKVNYKSAPSITTLNTLAQFAGYGNWRDFKNRSRTKKHPLRNRLNSNMGIIMLAASLMTVVFISFFSLRGPKHGEMDLDVSEIQFQSRPITKGLPNSVVFDVNLGTISSDSVYIQQYWDPTKTIKLEKGQKQATGQYYFPGYFRAKLLVDGNIIKQHDLFIKSEGWLGTLDYQPIPKYVEQASILNGKLSLPPALLGEIASAEKPLSSTFHLVDDFKAVSGDNFRLLTTLKSSFHEKWAVCQRVDIIILGTKSSIILGLSIPGCVSELGVLMGDVYLSGKKHDLSGLGVDLSDYTDIKIEVVEKTMTAYVGDKLVFTGSYKESVGNIVGLRYGFLGAGEITRVHLQDIVDDGTILDEDFDGKP